MNRDKSESLTANLNICENCEWCSYSGLTGEFPSCMLNGQQKGLLEQCDRFKRKTGEHFTFYY